jgi:hypothetical protein
MRPTSDRVSKSAIGNRRFSHRQRISCSSPTRPLRSMAYASCYVFTDNATRRRYRADLEADPMMRRWLAQHLRIELHEQ